MKTNAYAGLIALSVAALLGGAAAAQTAVQTSTQAPAPARHARLDTDGDRRISQAEFVQARTARLTALDADHDGSVAPDEVRARVQAVRAERASDRFDRLDADKNGQISRAEFDAARAPHDDAARAGRGERGHRMARHAGRGARHDGARMNAARVADRGPVSIADVQTRAAATFARLDADHDGFLTSAEVRAARGERAGRGEGRAARRMGRPMAPAATPPSPAAPASE
ncbi:hypothetical protein BH09PSE1_BH09PSE1_18070 [soil metagenome]